jgi:hypothetical protein
MRRVRPLLALLVLALACAPDALAHGEGAHHGFVSTVSAVEPPQLGLLVHVLGGHERLSVRNLTQKTVRFEEPGLVLAPGEAAAWADPRIAPTTGRPRREGLVRNWRIPGTADGEPFEIVGFLGYAGPLPSQDDGVPAWAIVVAGGAGALVVAAAVALPLRRREGESEAP